MAGFLLETRSHLEERVEDLVGKGMDRSSACKAAVADFGDPDSVVDAYWGRKPLSKKGYWGWLIAAVLFAGAMGGPFNALIFETFQPIGISFIPVFTLLPFLAVCIVIWLAWRTRTWASLWVGAGAIVCGLLGSVFTAGRTEIVPTRYQQRLMSKSQIPGEIADRQAWLTAYRTDFERIQAWRQARAEKATNADKLLQALASNDGQYSFRDSYLAPVPNYWGGGLTTLLPSTYTTGISTVSLLDDSDRRYSLTHWGGFKAAKDVWNQNGDGYAEYLKSVRTRVEAEIGLLQHLPPSSRWERFKLIAGPTVGASVSGALVLITVNGLILGLGAGRQRYRRNVWRRQLG
jgi:hypothetical protein